MAQKSLRFELDGLSDPADPPYQRHSTTSRDASRQIVPNQGSLKAIVHNYIKSCGTRGCTDEEAQIELDMNPSTQRPRRVELVRDGMVIDSGRQRKTRSGRNATVWVIKQT